MTHDELEHKLLRCQELAREYPDGPMSETIRDVEEEVRELLRAFQE